MLTTVIVLFVLKGLKCVKFPDFTYDVISKIWPLPLFYMVNMLFGLAGTQELSLPMLTVLRRFSIFFTMMLEYWILGNKPSNPVKLSVALMIFGAFVAASNDLAFNLRGYLFVLGNNLATAGNGVVTKKKLNSRDLGKYGLMYYNSLFMLLPTFIICYSTGGLDSAFEYQGWSNPVFIFEFVLSCFFGFILIYSVTLCTQINSALDTTIIGCLKNILITYIGMIIGGDYVFSWINFIGLNISIIGSLIYTKVSFGSNSPKTSPNSASTLNDVKTASNNNTVESV